MGDMLIAAISDTHGLLPSINPCSVACICGDIFPQTIERNVIESERWFKDTFVKWIESLPCQLVIMIPRNHCFYLESQYKINTSIDLPNSIKKKCICLFDQEYVYQGIHFYGSPWVNNLPRWAFNTDDLNSKFEKIPNNCDILLTHHAPDYGKLGCSYPNTDKERNFGSADLAEAIKCRPKIKYHFCGHIHTGTHGGVKIGNALSFNVSILDEQYQLAFPVTYIIYNQEQD